MEAVLTSKSRIEAKVAILKPISAAIGIGTGGPFGAEGPIIQTGGAFGSLVGQLVSTTASERKVLLACGAGAGLAAMFNAPITGALLAIELLLFEFQARSFIPLMLANALAVAVRLRLFGDETMFHVGSFDYDLIHGIPFYLLPRLDLRAGGDRFCLGSEIPGRIFRPHEENSDRAASGASGRWAWALSVIFSRACSARVTKPSGMS